MWYSNKDFGKDYTITIASMPKRYHALLEGHYYHVYNRGLNKQDIFNDAADYERFYQSLEYYRYANLPLGLSDYRRLKAEHKEFYVNAHLRDDNKQISLISYALLPNHFHLLLIQKKENGIHSFVHNISDSYTKYYNARHNRSGPLLQGRFKSVPIESDEQLIHTSRYIVLNPVVGGVIGIEDLSDYRWTAYREYVCTHNGICDKEAIYDFFPTEADYSEFITSSANQNSSDFVSNIT